MQEMHNASVVTPKVLRQFVRPKDVIAATGLSKSAVMAALRSGDLKGLRHGRSWLVPIDAVDEWLTTGAQTAPNAA